MIDDDEVCFVCDGAIGMMVPAEQRCRCALTVLSDHPYRQAAPLPMPETPLNLVDVFRIYGNGAALRPMGPPPDPEDG